MNFKHDTVKHDTEFEILLKKISESRRHFEHIQTENEIQEEINEILENIEEVDIKLHPKFIRNIINTLDTIIANIKNFDIALKRPKTKPIEQPKKLALYKREQKVDAKILNVAIVFKNNIK